MSKVSQHPLYTKVIHNKKLAEPCTSCKQVELDALLYAAVRFDKPNSAHTLLKYKANPRQKNKWHNTSLLHLSALNKTTKILKLLLSYIKVDEQNTLGRTALHFATEHNNPTAINVLLENGAQCRLEDE